MAKRQFKTESKRILNMMINSIYTHKEVFLRELISNASDALDKLYIRAIAGGETGIARDDLNIDIAIDKDARTLTIRDNGCGMTRDELIEDLGTIAKSGTLDFRQEHRDEADIIGQFGVGFYSAFMVSKKIEVRSRAYGEETAYLWQSTGEDGYSIDPCEFDGHGTEITLYLLDDTEEEQYDKYLKDYTISSLVKKYSDYIRYPIRMEMTHERLKEGSDKEYESYQELETLNSRVPIWRRKKEDVTQEDYNNFYRDKFFDYQDPTRVLTTDVEGAVTYSALLFIPKSLPYDYYTKNFEKGLQLYCNGVMIMEKCPDLLPDYFGFVRGIVDSADFSLNISREMLQHDRQLKAIAKHIEKKLRQELSKMLENEREAYEAFFATFGGQLKYGAYSDYGLHKDELQELLLFHSLDKDKPVTLKEYVDAMGAEQKYIYYACGESVAKIGMLPQTEAVREKGCDILCLTEDIDEFCVKVLSEYAGKTFKSVADPDLGLISDEEKKQIEERTEASKDVLNAIEKALEGKVKRVRLSPRLVKHPVCLTSDGGLSLDMEKVLNAMPEANKVKAERVLEINPAHPVFAAMEAAKDDADKLSAYAGLLYDQALLIAGLPIDDPVAFSNAVCDLMIQ